MVVTVPPQDFFVRRTRMVYMTTNHPKSFRPAAAPSRATAPLLSAVQSGSCWKQVDPFSQVHWRCGQYQVDPSSAARAHEPVHSRSRSQFPMPRSDFFHPISTHERRHDGACTLALSGQCCTVASRRPYPPRTYPTHEKRHDGACALAASE